MLWARERATAGCSGSFGEVGRGALVAGNSGEAGLDDGSEASARSSSTETRSKCNSKCRGLEFGRCLAIDSCYSPIGLCVLAVLEESSVFTYTCSASKHEASV